MEIKAFNNYSSEFKLIQDFEREQQKKMVAPIVQVANSQVIETVQARSLESVEKLPLSKETADRVWSQANSTVVTREGIAPLSSPAWHQNLVENEAVFKMFPYESTLSNFAMTIVLKLGEANEQIAKHMHEDRHTEAEELRKRTKRQRRQHFDPPSTLMVNQKLLNESTHLVPMPAERVPLARKVVAHRA